MNKVFNAAILAITLAACTGDGVQIPIQNYNLHSVGAADFNGDGVPDLYTTNHNAAPSILLGAKTPWIKLPHDPRFPALADLAEEPETPQNGALLYWHRMAFKIATGALEKPLSGSVTFRGKPIVDVPVERLDATHYRVRFKLTSNQKLVIRHEPPIAGLPVTLHIDSDPSILSIGQMGDHPDTDTEFRLRDYHDILAKDIDRDGDIDIVALGGGMRGHAAELAPNAMEQTFINEGGHFLTTDGPPKLGCATRGAAWEGDTLQVSCAREQLDNAWIWRDKWIGGPVNQRTKAHKHWCSEDTLLQYGVEPDMQFHSCLEADFDNDGDEELVVVTDAGNKMFIATYYEKIGARQSSKQTLHD
ncbi:MAG TPA: FG-GAP repeat protein [Pseudomonadales bacterium]